MLARIGEIEIWRVLESVDPFIKLFTFFPDLTEDLLDEHRDTVLPDSYRIDPEDGTLWLTIPVQSFLLKAPGRVILVDACIGNDKTVPIYAGWNGARGDRFMAGLAAAGVRPPEVDLVLCTHLHVDHVGWTTTLKDGTWVPTFPNARVLATEADIAFARDAAAKAGPKQTMGHVMEQTLGPLMRADRLHAVDPEEEIAPGVRLYPTPGHTPGHVSVEINDRGATAALITGDVLHTSIQCALPGLSPIADNDPALAARSRRAMLEHLESTGALALGTHIPLPSMGRIRTRRDAFRWEPLA